MSLSKKLRFEVLKRDSFKCQYCGASAPDALLHVDHIKPVAEGGPDDIWNLVTACQPCNSGKSDRELSDRSVIAKAKNQLDMLNERREQIEMMMQWQQSLASIDTDLVQSVIDFSIERTGGSFKPLAALDRKLRALVVKNGAEVVMQAISTSAIQNLEWQDDGHVTADSAEKYFGMIGSICEINKCTKGNPELKELYYVRGILRKRLDGKYCNEYQAMQWLQQASDVGVSVGQLKEVTLGALCWSHWRDNVSNLIEGAQNA